MTTDITLQTVTVAHEIRPYFSVLQNLMSVAPFSDNIRFIPVDGTFRPGINVFQMDPPLEKLWIVSASGQFIAMASPKYNTAYVEATDSPGERGVTLDIADAMVAMQNTLLDILQTKVKLIINTEDLTVPTSNANLTQELDKIRKDERLEKIYVIWSPILLQNINHPSTYSRRDRFTLTAIQFLNSVYSIARRGLAPVITYTHDQGLQEAARDIIG
jgi:hypothetical protein